MTDAGHYSPDGNSDRISCSTVTAPDDATADSARTGLSSANQCWTCNAGYDDHDDDGTCSVTAAGHYSPDGNSDRISCNTVTAPDDATADSASASTGLSSANQCWTCNAGYYDDHNDDGTCSVTAAGHYSPAGNSDRISCNTVTAPDDATADSASASTGLSSANQCWTCNAGYDDHDDDGTCSVTAAGHYSPAGNSDRISCNTVTAPDDATADSASASTGLSSANQCWTCNAGYDDHNDDGTCSVTDAGHYSPDGNSDRISCNTVTAPDDATADSASASTGLSSANQCWTCNAGYDDHNDDGTCSVTAAGHYSPAGNSDRIPCTVPDDATVDPTSTGLSSDANQCWTCNTGYDDHDDDGTCSVTGAGHYSPDGNSDRISCSTVTAPDDATADSASTGLSSANQCWTCNAGYDDHNDDGTCSVTGAGHYSPDGNSDRIPCTVPDDATADSVSTGLSSANQCWTCNTGYDDHNDDGTCSVTAAGHYSPAGNSDRISCNTVTAPDDATADSASASTGLSSANQCWTCNAGFDDHDDDGTCSVTDAGHYSPDGNSDRISCTVPDDATADPTSTGLSSANQCWTCNAGFDDHDDDGTCSVTDAGHYSPAGNSDRIPCTVPDDATADSASTGLSSANQCWTCNAGYVRAGNICARKITALVAGSSHTCALLEDKSVECWGKHQDSDYNYFNHIAPSLNNATALVAGYSHTCALLEDKSVECWGYDRYGQATAPSLNNATALVAGYNQTCALKEDKSVECWGNNGNGQATAPSLNNAKALVAGYRHTCALKEDKSVECWGKHYDGSSYVNQAGGYVIDIATPPNRVLPPALNALVLFERTGVPLPRHKGCRIVQAGGYVIDIATPPNRVLPPALNALVF